MDFFYFYTLHVDISIHLKFFKGEGRSRYGASKTQPSKKGGYYYYLLYYFVISVIILEKLVFVCLDVFKLLQFSFFFFPICLSFKVNLTMQPTYPWQDHKNEQVNKINRQNPLLLKRFLWGMKPCRGQNKTRNHGLNLTC